MGQRYVVRQGDTLAKVAKRFYGEATLYKRLAQYNGIPNPNLVAAGEVIEIPARNELEGKAPSATPVAVIGLDVKLQVPHGLDQVLATFGNIRNYILSDGSLSSRWESDYLDRAPLPYPIPLSWDRSQRVSRILCHKKLREIFPAVFAEIQRRGLQSEMRTFGGCFNYRAKRTSGKLSTHSWGIAIDLNPETNAQGTSGNMHPTVVEVFRQFGFSWGGNWSGKSKDPMHFQYCTGY